MRFVFTGWNVFVGNIRILSERLYEIIVPLREVAIQRLILLVTVT